MSYISIESDLTEAVELIDGLVKSRKSIKKAVLRRVATQGKNKAKRNYKSVLNKKSGYLYKTIRSYVYKNGRASVVTAHKPGDPVRYGFVLAAGATIEAKNEDYLTFKIGDKWVKKHSVRIEPRDFIEAPVKRYLDSAECKADMDAVIQKKIDQIEKKAANGKWIRDFT